MGEEGKEDRCIALRDNGANMKVAVFSPLPPAPTGVADYTQSLLEGLRTETDWEVHAYTEDCLPVQERDESALTVYQIGNSPHHDFIYPFVFRRPGVLVLHDLVLHHARLASYLESPEVTAYKAELGSIEKRDRALARLKEYSAEVQAAYPQAGATVAELAIQTGGGRLLYAYPLFELLVGASKSLVEQGWSARDIFAAGAGRFGARGGGRADLVQAGASAQSVDFEGAVGEIRSWISARARS